MKLQKKGMLTRLFVCIVFLVVFLLLCRYFSNGWEFLTDSNNKFNMLFVSAALLLVFGTYITEPFFTKPVDVLTNTIAIILALLSIKNPNNFLGYYYIFYSAVVIFILSLITIVLHNLKIATRLQDLFFTVVTNLGSSKIAFSTIYLLTVLSFLTDRPIAFVFFLTFWVIFITEFISVWIVNLCISLYKKIVMPSNMIFVGESIGCENPFLFKVEVDLSVYKKGKIKAGQLLLFTSNGSDGLIGLVINTKYLLNKQWLSVHILREDNNCFKLCNNKIERQNIYSQNVVQKAYLLDLNFFSAEQQTEITNNEFYKNKDLFVGYVIDGSDVNKIKFLPMIDHNNANYNLLKEGTIVTTYIYGQETLFQIIEGITVKEIMETHNINGYIVGIAQKLGKYIPTSRQIDSVKWVPDMYSPLFFKNPVIDNEENRNAKLSIGVLPGTEMKIDVKDINSLVTHNTAILGILGIGKSCLTFELIKKIVDNSNIKVICIDITNEYFKELQKYIAQPLIKYDIERIFNGIKSKQNYIYTEGTDRNIKYDYAKSGNLSEYRDIISNDLLEFLFNNTSVDVASAAFSVDKKIRIYNPDYHPVSKGEKMGFSAITVELTQAEKTRIICEELFKILMKKEASSTARVLLVFEEAHSLIPEWNSSANEGDSSAVNGTAKIILQGRKYGLGSFVITQRTANISKSILNQCNTIFALRVFDDTGKVFLENYIGSDYSNLLPTLEERHAIAVGKGLKLRLPVMIKLNDKENIIANSQERM